MSIYLGAEVTIDVGDIIAQFPNLSKEEFEELKMNVLCYEGEQKAKKISLEDVLYLEYFKKVKKEYSFKKFQELCPLKS